MPLASAAATHSAARRLRKMGRISSFSGSRSRIRCGLLPKREMLEEIVTIEHSTQTGEHPVAAGAEKELPIARLEDAVRRREREVRSVFFGNTPLPVKDARKCVISSRAPS